VVNELLQENHQVELAEALAGDGAAGRRYLYWSTCEQLCTALAAARFECLDRFPAADTAALPRMVDALMGFA
jgi:hypothetical protein